MNPELALGGSPGRPVGSMAEFEIRPTAPLDVAASLAFLSRCRDESVDVVSGDTWRRLFVTEQGGVVAEARSAGSVDAPLVIVRTSTDEPRAAQAVLAAVRRVLNADADPAPWFEAAARVPVLRSLAAERRGIRPVGTPSVFEALVWAITGQHVALGVACVLKQRLARLYGLRSGGLAGFPTVEALASADPDLLGQAGFTRAKHGAIIGAAQAVKAGALDIEQLADVPRADAYAALVALRGVGPWTAEYVLGRGLLDDDAFPAGDVGLRQAVERITVQGRLPTEAVSSFAEPVRGHRAWLTFLLWNTLEA